MKSKFIQISGITFLLICISLSSASQDRYNVIWISAEDMGPELGCYGNNDLSTPNIDRLANEGVRYTNAYSTVGVCAPSRFSIITGLYPAGYGAHNMRTGNYYTYVPSEEVEYRSNLNIRDITSRNVPEYSVVLPAGVKCFTEYLRTQGYACFNQQKCDYQFPAPLTAWDESSGQADFSQADKDQPFFYVKNHMVTHESRIWMREDEPLTVHPDSVKIPDYFADIPEVRQAIARKYSNIEELDRQVGELLDRLEEENLLEKTIIFFWSDHGGPLLRQKRAVVNQGLHVPLIVRYPDKKDAGTVDSNIVSLMDLGPTVMSLLGIEPPEYMDGKAFAGEHQQMDGRDYIIGSADRFDEQTDMRRSVIDGRYVYVRNFLPQLPYSIRIGYREQIPMNKILLEKGAKGELSGDPAYIHARTKPLEELYDLRSDPYEVNNLAKDPAYKDKLSEMRKVLADWQLQVGDKGFIPEHDLIRMFWPGMKQPVAKKVDFEVDGSKNLKLFSATEGASIAFQINDHIGNEHWELYHDKTQIKADDKVVAKAVRIGFKDSGISYWNVR